MDDLVDEPEQEKLVDEEPDHENLVDDLVDDPEE